MLKALFKKEILRLMCSMSARNNKKKKRSGKEHTSNKGPIILFIAVWGFVLFALAMAFAGISSLFSDLLIPAGLDWLYYAIIGCFAFALSVIGNSFTASSIIFKARDNELLLTMPIPPAYILATRILLVFVMGVLFACVPMVPAFILPAVSYGGVGVKGFIICFVLIISLALIVTAISALLGWLLAFISKHIKHKSIATTAFTFIFLAVYYFVYFNMNKYIQALAANSLQIGSAIESSVFGRPILYFGMAAAGDIKSLLLFAVFSIVVFCIVYVILTRKLGKILTMSEASISKDYDEKEERQQSAVTQKSPKKALLKKELELFLSSPVYMTNCGLGLILLLAGAVLIAIKFGYLGGVSAALQYAAGDTNPALLEMADVALSGDGAIAGLLSGLSAAEVPIVGRIFDALPVMVMFIVWGLLSTCSTATPSVAIEGRRLWILKIMPVSTLDVLMAKKNLQLYICAPIAVIFVLLAGFALRFSWTVTLYLVITALLFIELHACGGLLMGLVNPQLDWTNEAVPVKQSIAVLIIFFIGPFVGLALGALYFFVLYKWINVEEFLLGLIVILALGVRILDRVLRTKGVEMYDAL